jgi:hypothetical protein
MWELTDFLTSYLTSAMSELPERGLKEATALKKVIRPKAKPCFV